MKIADLTFRNLRGLRDGRLSFQGAERPSSITLITGPAGSGKSSLLRAVAAARCSVFAHGTPPVAADVLTEGVSTGVLEATWHVSPEEQKLAGLPTESPRSVWKVGEKLAADAAPELRQLFSRHGHGAAQPKLEWIPAPRRLPVTRTTMLPSGFSESMEAPKRARDAEDKYDSLLRALHDAASSQAALTMRALDEKGLAFHGQVPDTLAPVKENVARLCRDIRLMRVEPRANLRPFVWFRRRTGTEVELERLSQSEHQGFLFAALFAMVGLHGSIVLVDTPELHLHPDDHRTFFRALCELGTDNQILAATTSPSILASVGADQIIDLGRKDRAS